MRIIRPGNRNSKNIKQFSCNNCGCIFEADEDEYATTIDEQILVHKYYCICPECAAIVPWVRVLK